MKPETRKALTEEEADFRSRGEALISHAEKIRALLKSDELFMAQTALNSQSEPQPEVVRIRRTEESLMSQTQASEHALREIGQPSSVSDILEHIKARGFPVRTSNADNLRSVLSRSNVFVNTGHGRWWIASETPSSKATSKANGHAASSPSQYDVEDDDDVPF